MLAISFAGEYGDTDYWQGDKTVYIEPARVIMDSKKGTSVQLNHSLYAVASNSGTFKYRLNYNLAHLNHEGKITFVTNDNLFLLEKCNWDVNALKCSVDNEIWMLRTTIVVGDKYSTINMILFDHAGQIISQSNKTIHGTIRWKPQWKLTRIKANSMYGQETKEIFEQWPHKMEELPPLIMPAHIHQAVLGVYLGM
tara:strand:- start:349 stop:936 length:588 start_codon:yes stop_codon:yes gene_type:complete